MRRRAVLIAAALLMLIGIPRAGSAGVLDIIWELSGPRMIGIGAYCRFTLDGASVGCFPVRQEEALLQQARNHRPWIATEGSFYFTVGKKNGFEPGDAYMVAIEPSLEIPYAIGGTKWLFYSGVGLTYDVLFGPDFDTFDNVGIKLRPFAFQRKGWGLAYNIRLYADDFGHDLFNRAPPVTGDRLKETVHSISITLPF